MILNLVAMFCMTVIIVAVIWCARDVMVELFKAIQEEGRQK